MVRINYFGGPYDGATSSIDETQFPSHLSVEICHLTDCFLHIYSSFCTVADVVNSLPEGSIPVVEVFHSGVEVRRDRSPFLETE